MKNPRKIDLKWIQWFIGLVDAEQKRGLMTSSSLSAPSRRLTRMERQSFVLTAQLIEVIIGSALGDLNIQNTGNYSRLCFKQSSINMGYMEHLYQLFSPYCSMQTPLRQYETLDKGPVRVIALYGLTLILSLVLILIILFSILTPPAPRTGCLWPSRRVRPSGPGVSPCGCIRMPQPAPPS